MIFKSNIRWEIKRMFRGTKKWLVVSATTFVIAACGYQGVEVYFFEEYASIMDDEHYKGDADRNEQQIAAFESLIADLRESDPDYSWSIDPVADNAGTAQNVDERNTDLHERSQEQRDFHDALARYHSPVIYQDMDNAWRSDEGASDQSDAAVFGRKVGVRDLPTPLILTTPQNVKSNPSYMDELLDDPADLAAIIPTVYQEVKETHTHYFITYVLYYPHNRFENAAYKVPGAFPSPQSFDHDQDIEFVLVAIRKDADVAGGGEVELILTTRHGTAHLHHPDPEIEKRLRKAFGGHISESDRTDVAMGPIYQPHAIRHDNSGTATFLLDNSGNRMGIHLYAPRFGHALNRANPDVWREGYGTGLILVPGSQDLPADSFDFDSDLAKNGVRPYQLLSWSDVMDTYRANRNVFVGSNRFETTLSDGRIRQRSGSPDAIIAGEGEPEAKTVLPNASDADTPHRMALPHAVLAFFDELLGDDSHIDGEISDYYVYNPEIEYTSLED